MFTRIQDVAPGAIQSYSAKSALFTTASADRGTLFDCTGSFTITLGTTGLSAGWSCWIRNISGTQTLDPSGAVTINGASTYALSNAGDDVLVMFDGTNFIVSHHQRPSTVAITGGTINGTTIGATTAASGVFTTLNTSGAAVFGSTSAVASNTSHSFASHSGQTGTTQSVVTMTATSQGACTTLRGLNFLSTTDNSTQTITSLVGGFFGNNTKGANDTVTRSGGLHVRQQTVGATGNFGLVYSNATGLPTASGTWAIYVDSTDASFFGGAVTINTGALTMAATTGTTLVVSSTATNSVTLAGGMVVGETTSRTYGAVAPVVQLSSTAAAGSAFGIVRHSAGGNAPRLIMGASRGAAGTATAVQSGDVLFQFDCIGADGTDTATVGAQQIAVVDGTVATDIIPTAFRWNTMNAAGTLAQRLFLSAAGSLVCGALSALGTTATDGFVYIPTCAGAPTGVPTAYTGKVAMIFDTTNNRLYVYDGGWISSAFA